MTSKNDITGDNLVSKTSNPNFRDNYDKVFKKRPECPRCGKTLSGDPIHIHTCTPKER